MAVRIYVNGSAVIVSDDTTGAIIKDGIKGDIYYESKALEIDLKISLFYLKDNKPFYSTLLSNAKDNGTVPTTYTKTAFREFCNDNLGNVNASAGANITDYRSEFVTPYIYSGWNSDGSPEIIRESSIIEYAQGLTDLETDWAVKTTLTYI